MIPPENYGLEHMIKLQREAFNKSINEAREAFMKSITERRESFIKSMQNRYPLCPSVMESRPFLFDLDRLGAYTAMSKLADKSNIFRSLTEKKFELSNSCSNK